MTRKLAAEFMGTAWLVLGGCGSAVLAAAFPELGIGFAGVPLAFGLTVLTMAFAIGHVSGCHFNPAVSAGCGRAAGRCSSYSCSWVAPIAGTAIAGFVYPLAIRWLSADK
ncbi:MAG TPA: aquaporin [Rhizomicrobium sp.]|nr:aquaporin [Rhizomicrobium sp.]